MDQPTIVLTTDFSKEAERAYGPTVDFAKQMGASIVLLHVVSSLAIPAHGAPFAPMQNDPDLPEHLQEAEASLQKEKAKLEAARPGAGVAIETLAHGTSGEVAEAVAKVAEEKGAAFIALSTHGRTGLRRLILGSVAEAVVRRARCPVMTFPGH
jgi:nucleotide-binding universal stress UspA family protein